MHLQLVFWCRYRAQALPLTTLVLFTNAGSVLLGQLVPSLTGQIIYCALFGASFGAYITSLSVVIQQVGSSWAKEN